VAGLQLAGLSLRGQPDVAGFVASFSGSHRYVLDFLIEEVLDRQPGEVRGFLLETSVLERLSGELCDAVTGRTGSQRLLEWLERANLFLVPLDEVRGWWRYHQLFADLLRARLEQERPERVPALHRNAAAWCREHQPADDAVRHALAAGIPPRPRWWSSSTSTGSSCAAKGRLWPGGLRPCRASSHPPAHGSASRRRSWRSRAATWTQPSHRSTPRSARSRMLPMSPSSARPRACWRTSPRRLRLNAPSSPKARRWRPARAAGRGPAGRTGPRARRPGRLSGSAGALLRAGHRGHRTVRGPAHAGVPQPDRAAERTRTAGAATAGGR
jgi:hypothetical protein